MSRCYNSRGRDFGALSSAVQMTAIKAAETFLVSSKIGAYQAKDLTGCERCKQKGDYLRVNQTQQPCFHADSGRFRHKDGRRNGAMMWPKTGTCEQSLRFAARFQIAQALRWVLSIQQSLQITPASRLSHRRLWWNWGASAKL